ncbi:UNVERIFIED_CONTAM: hypothetical protein FKN15_067572 [Acipenser sinensis]
MPSLQSPLSSRWGPLSPVRGPSLEAPEGPTHPQARPWKRAKIKEIGLEGAMGTGVDGGMGRAPRSVERGKREVLWGGGRSAGRGPAESGCPISDEESDYRPNELEGETPGAWDLPLDYLFVLWP